MITAKTLAETKPMNNTKKERISNDKKPNRICFFDLLRFIIITAFPFSLYHKIARSARGIIKMLFARAKSYLTYSLFTITYYLPKNPYTPN